MLFYGKKKLSLRILSTVFTVLLIITCTTSTASAKSESSTENSTVNFLSALGIDYDPEKMTFEGSNGGGLLGTGFDYDMKQGIFYGSDNCWQRNFGYSTFYDDMAPAVFMYFDCLRFYFDYNGKSWLIQAWKGQYGITTGCELGVYYKSPEREIKHYDCVKDSDRLPMTITLSHKGENLFMRDMEDHWWLTGFVMFDLIPAEELDMEFEIKFPDKDMLKAFKNSITDDMDIDYSISGKTFKCSWDASAA